MVNEKLSTNNNQWEGQDGYTFVVYGGSRYGRKRVNGPISKKYLGFWSKGQVGWVPEEDYQRLTRHGFRKIERGAVADAPEVEDNYEDDIPEGEIEDVETVESVEDVNLHSDITAINGIGEKLAAAFIEAGFDSIEKIAAANVDDLILPEQRVYRSKAAKIKDAAMEFCLEND